MSPELPHKPIQRRLNVHLDCCGQCGERLQRRHVINTTAAAALEMAAVQLEPVAQGTMAWLNKSLGLTRGRIEKLFQVLFEITTNRSTSVC